MKTAGSRILNGFFIGAFILALISPACAFVSGKSGYIEICASDGSSQKIEISEDDAAYALYALLNETQDTQENLPSEGDAKKGECGFCFAQSHITKDMPSADNILFMQRGDVLAVGSGTIAFKAAAIVAYDSRGPPLFI